MLTTNIVATRFGRHQGNNGIARCGRNILQINRHGVLVGFHEFIGCINDVPGKVHDAKLVFGEAIRSEQTWGLSILGHYFGHKRHITSTGADALFVESVENACFPSRYQFQNVGICFVGNILCQTFSCVLLNHTFKEVTSKHILKPFIGIIDAQLLKSIRLKRLESKNIQHPNEPIASIVVRLVGSTTTTRTTTAMDRRRCRINLAHKPQKDSRIKFLGIGITTFLGLLR
mmetsp:Transcript_40011/g.83309  ORF Transcript_40011/g.83309 Transcript_40011/m.83309 type:complete len:230 (+) Transcript_40011:2110-2799(+)